MANSDFAFIFDSGSTVKDLFYDFGIHVSAWNGGGMPPNRNITVPYAIGDGTAFQRTVLGERVIQLVCVVEVKTVAALHSSRKAVEAAISRDALNSQTFTLRYYSAGATAIDIPVRYHAGLEGSVKISNLSEKFVISLLACDPFWRTSSVITETFAAAGAVANSGYIAQRASDGTWTGLSGTNSPAAGANCILFANSKLYVAAGNNLHIRTAGTWAVYAANGAVNSLCLGADGVTVYVGGAFTVINGVSTNYFASLSGTTFSAVTGAPGAIRLIALGGGVFVVARPSTATIVYAWDGASTWTTVKSIASTNAPPINTLTAINYAGFGSALAWITDDTSTDIVAYGGWNGSAFSGYAVWGTAAITSIKALYFDPTYGTYIAGSFTSVSGVTVAGLAKIGAGWTAISGSATTVNAIAVNGYAVYAGGTFTNYAVNVAGWASLGALPPAAITALFIDKVTGILYASWNSASNMSIGSDLSKTITLVGDQNAYPASIVITRTGGTSATLTAITNTFTGKALLFNYALSAGEVITIVLTPGSKAITSSSGASIVPLPGSAFSTWALSPGVHNYTVSINGVGSPTIAATLTYSPSYQSADSIAA